MSALSARETWRTLLEKAEKTRGSDDLGWLRTKEDGLCTDVTPDFLVPLLSHARWQWAAVLSVDWPIS
jgi:hypothetical protein